MKPHFCAKNEKNKHWISTKILKCLLPIFGAGTGTTEVNRWHNSMWSIFNFMPSPFALGRCYRDELLTANSEVSTSSHETLNFPEFCIRAKTLHVKVWNMADLSAAKLWTWAFRTRKLWVWQRARLSKSWSFLLVCNLFLDSLVLMP